MLLRLRFIYFASLASIVLALAACQVSPSPDHPPDHVVVGIEANPLQLDPRYATDANSARIGALIYNSLLRADEHARLRSELAESWSMPDPRTYLFELRKDVRFHDGTPLTATDVKYTYESIKVAANRSPKRGLLDPLETVEVAGKHKVRFHLSQRHAPFVEHFTFGIVPAGSQAALDTAPPIGSGPFILQTIMPGESVTLKANPSYWEGKPQVGGIVFKVVPDALVRVLEFKQGAIDFLQNDIEPDILPWLKENTGAAIQVHPGTTFQYLGINLTHPILQNRKVRQALALAIDRERLIRHLLKNMVTAASGLLSPLNWAYEDAVEHWPFDPGKAKRLLDEAGFPDPDGDGPMARFRVSYKTTNIDLRRRVAEALKEQLAQVGIELEVRTFEWGTFYGDVKKGNFHIFSLAWVGIADPDIYYQIFHSDSVPPNGDNRGRYHNPELDRLLEQGRTTTNIAARKILYSQVQKIVAQDLPYIPLWWWNNVVVTKPALRGFVPYPDGNLISLKNIHLRGQGSPP